jgi:hypothetical protein
MHHAHLFVLLSHTATWYIFLGDNYSFSPFRPMTVKLLMLSATIQATKLLRLTLNNKCRIKKFFFILVDHTCLLKVHKI